MADIDGGALSFKSVMDNEQLNSAIEETLRRVQGFSNAVVDSGSVMDKTTQGWVTQIRSTLGQIGNACAEHEQALNRLGQEYDRLGDEMNNALKSGRDDEFRALRDKRNAIKGEITMRKQLLRELHENSNALEEEATKLENSAKQAENATKAHVSLRSQMNKLKNEMAAILDESDGDKHSAAYVALEKRLGRLKDIQLDIEQQAKVLSNDEAKFQGLIEGLGGVVGGFEAAQGAVALFAGENENLQKIMTRVQSLMSITMGLQQMAQALNEDSAFQLVTINGLKEWWNKLLDVGRGKQVAATAATNADTASKETNTGATGANTAAKEANTSAAVAGTKANIGLAGAFRMVGAAIKSIPGVGWIIAAISALVGAIGYFVSEAQKAKKATEDWYNSIAENAYKPIASIEQLSAEWKSLGNDLEAKKRFIEQNAQAFDELGVAINGVTDAENLLSKNKDKFIQSQIEKAKAMVLVQQAQDKVKALVQKEQAYNAMPETVTKNVMDGVASNGAPIFKQIEVINDAKAEALKEIEVLRAEIDKGFTDAAIAEQEGLKALEEAGIDAITEYDEGTIGALEQAIQNKQAKLKKLKIGSKDFVDTQKEIAKLQKRLNQSPTNTKDPFLDTLNKYKTEYQRFNKWINSGDAILAQSAHKEFEGLLKEGATYIDYLKKQRDQILAIDVANRTKEQNKQLEQLNDAIAEETKVTVLEAFNTELNEQLANASTVIEMLKIIEQKRKELANDGTDIDNAKAETLNDAEKNAQEQLKDETEALLAEYASYAEQKRRIDEAYNRDYELLMARRAKATTDAERAEIDEAMANRKDKRDNDVNGIGEVDYNAILAEYGTFEEKKQAIIDEYEEKRKAARIQGNEELVKALDNAQAKAISSLATNELTGSEMWSNLFSNLDEMTANEIETLIQQIESQFNNLAVSFNPSDLTEIRNQLNKAKDILVQDNPFKQMGQALKAVFKNTSSDSKDSADDIKENWQKLGKATEESFDFINNAINQCEPLKDIIGDVGTTALSSLQATAMAAIGVATAVNTAEKSSVILVIIQAALAVVQAVFALFQLKDKQIQKQIQEHESAVNRLQDTYKQLSWEIDRALGGDYYKLQKQAIQNLEEQKRHIKEAQQLEEGRKKGDKEKIEAFAEEQRDLNRQIQDTYDEIAEDILQTTGKEFADELADALVSAFEKGEDAAKVFEETVNNVLKNAIVNQLKKQFLETQMQGALDKLMKDMGQFDSDGKFNFDGLSDDEIADFKDKVQTATDNFQEALKQVGDIIKLPDDMQENSLSGAVKGISEQTAEIVAGQMNAIRINQIEATEVMRQQLMILNTIAVNTSYNRHLAKLENILAVLENNSIGNSLRSQGLS